VWSLRREGYMDNEKDSVSIHLHSDGEVIRLTDLAASGTKVPGGRRPLKIDSKRLAELRAKRERDRAAGGWSIDDGSAR
jgi:hypothetical protein